MPTVPMEASVRPSSGGRLPNALLAQASAKVAIKQTMSRLDKAIKGMRRKNQRLAAGDACLESRLGKRESDNRFNLGSDQERRPLIGDHSRES